MDVPGSSEQNGRLRKRLPLTNTPLKYTEVAKKFPENHDVDEEMRMINQARLARKLKKELPKRFSGKGQPNSTYLFDREKSCVSSRWSPVFVDKYFAPGELERLEKLMVVKLDDVRAIYPFDGLGTLEVHHNRCIYHTSAGLGIHLCLMTSDIKGCAWRVDENGYNFPPLLIFHLRVPIMVGSRETKNIQFLLNPPKHSKDLIHFIDQVKSTQSTCRSGVPITLLHFQPLVECEFIGVYPTGKAAIFALACSALVELVGPPFGVISLGDIEIVNLSLYQPETVHMTVVFKDFGRDVLEVYSIPSKFLTSIKDRLDNANVKYYVNSEENLENLNWNMTLRNIIKFPENFIRAGGWECLEDSCTRAYYPIADSVLDKDLAENFVIW